MQSTTHSAGTKIVFWTVIIVMVLGSVVSFSAFSFLSPSQQGANIQTNTGDSESGILEGIVRKIDFEEENQVAYYLETAGTMIALLTTSNPKINIDKYVDSEVEIQGTASGSDEENSAPMLDITSIDFANQL